MPGNKPERGSESDVNRLSERLENFSIQSQEKLHSNLNSQILLKLESPGLISFSETCHAFRKLTQPERGKRELESASYLLEAVVLGKKADVEKTLKKNPALLINTKGITKEYSGKITKGLSPFQAALCGDDDDMALMMKPYFDKIENGQAIMVEQFDAIFPNGLEAHREAQKKAAFDCSEIIEAILDAPIEDVQSALTKQFDINKPLYKKIDDFRQQFSKVSLNEKAFNLYHYLKAEEQYREAYNQTDSWGRRDLIWRQVVGWTQRFFSAYWGQAFAQGVYYLVKENEALNRHFNSRQNGDAVFPLRERAGLGFDEAASQLSGGLWLTCLAGGISPMGEAVGIFTDIISRKNNRFNKLTFTPAVIEKAMYNFLK